MQCLPDVNAGVVDSAQLLLAPAQMAQVSTLIVVFFVKSTLESTFPRQIGRRVCWRLIPLSQVHQTYRGGRAKSENGAGFPVFRVPLSRLFGMPVAVSTAFWAPRGTVETPDRSVATQCPLRARRRPAAARHSHTTYRATWEQRDEPWCVCYQTYISCKKSYN